MTIECQGGRHVAGRGSHAYDQIILFGDSITQQSENQERGFGFAPALRDDYIRRLDVVNRGFSGYTSQLALQVLPHFMPDRSQAHVRMMTVFFGANDATVPGNAQHVPLVDYTACLKAIVQHHVVTAQGSRIILITPAPVDEYQLEPNDLATGYNGLQRTAENTKRYAEACREMGKDLVVPVVDIWTLFAEAAGWKEGGPLPGSKGTDRNQVLGSLLVDGLHFTPDGYKLMYKAVTKVIKEKLTELSPENLPFVFPPWVEALKQSL